MNRIFGREPAAVVEMFVAVALGIVVILHPSEPVTAAANAVVVAVGGFALAALVKHEGALAALVGAIKAVFALVVVLGMHLDPTLETGIVMIVSAIGMAFVRQNVVAKVPQNRDFQLTN